MKILSTVINNFEAENPSIKINLQHVPQNYFKKLHLLLASKSEPDIILINNQNLPTYAKYLYTFDKSKFIGYFPNSIKSLSYNNELKAAPRDISTLVFYYNKNLVTPKKNWNIQDFLSDAETLKAKNIFLTALEPDLFYVYPFIIEFDENAETLNETNFEEYKSLKFYKSLSAIYHYAPEAHELGMSTPAEFFLNQHCAYYLSGRWMTPKITEKATFPWGYIEFPRNHTTNSVPCDATGWAISKRTKHLDEALKFINYLSKDETLIKLSSEKIFVPAKINVAKSVNTPDIFIQLGYKSKTLNYPQKYDIIKDKMNKYLKK